MKLSKSSLIALAAAGVIYGSAGASASVISSITAGPGLGIAIPDNAYDGTLGSMANSSIVVGGGLGAVEKVVVAVAIGHTWVGDLTIKLEGPTGTVVTLMSRPGLAEAADDGSDCCGYSSDLVIANPITFDDDATTSAELIGFSGSPIPSATFHPDPGAAGGPSLSGFDGLASVGTWTLYVGDGAGADVGTIDSWTLSLTTASTQVPEPGTLALFGVGLAGLGAIRRRRRT